MSDRKTSPNNFSSNSGQILPTKLLVFLGFIVLVIGFFSYRKFSINRAWNQLKTIQDDDNYQQKSKALQTINFWKGLDEANLQGMNLTKISLPNAKVFLLNFSDANLRNADLSNGQFFSANFNNADLININFSNSDISSNVFINANLSNANLSNADLSRSQFVDANLNNANLTNANLNQTILINAKNLTPAQIKSACYWEQAVFKGEYKDYAGGGTLTIYTEEQNNYIQELKADQDSDPQTPPNCSQWR